MAPERKIGMKPNTKSGRAGWSGLARGLKSECLIPGALCGRLAHPIDSGTLNRQHLQRPGPLGLDDELVWRPGEGPEEVIAGPGWRRNEALSFPLAANRIEPSGSLVRNALDTGPTGVWSAA